MLTFKEYIMEGEKSSHLVHLLASTPRKSSHLNNLASTARNLGFEYKGSEISGPEVPDKREIHTFTHPKTNHSVSITHPIDKPEKSVYGIQHIKGTGYAISIGTAPKDLHRHLKMLGH